MLHSFDLMHGVHVWKGTRYSLILWFKDSPQAVRDGTTPWYDEAVEQGDVDAMYSLAGNFERGAHGKPKDLGLARRLYERSADAGHHLAQHTLGVLYQKLALGAEEAGVEAGMAAALRSQSIKWLHAAALSGFAPAQRTLAVCLGCGSGAAADTGLELAWLRRAAEQLDAQAARRLGERLWDDDEAEAAQWLQRSASMGLTTAVASLAALRAGSRQAEQGDGNVGSKIPDA